MDTNKEPIRTFAEIAQEIGQLWSKDKMYFGARPYYNAMLQLHTKDPESLYGFDKAGDIVRYFLANAQAFRGDNAKRIKAELKSML